MNLQSIISITGKPGLFKVITQTKNGLIVESIIDKRRMPVYSSEKVSPLEDISIYTNEGDLPLAEVYEKFYKKTAGKKTIDHKSDPEKLRSYLKELVTDYDEDRVYNSDLKKMFQWFNILIDADLLKPEKKEESKKDKDADAKPATKTKAKSTKKAAPKAKKPTPKTSGAKGGAKTATPSKKGK